MKRPGSALVVAVAVGLFLVWSNSFIAVSYLVGGDQVAARLDWLSLTVARFLPAAILCGTYCLVRHARESLAVMHRHWRRLLVAALAAVPGYNLALYYGQAHGVPAPIASLTTALLPLFVMVLAAVFLGERLSRRHAGGFLVAVGGMSLVALARHGETEGYGITVVVTALAPLCWSIFTVVSKPAAGRVRPLLWTYLAITVGGWVLLPLLPHAWDPCLALDARGWLAVGYLTVPSTVLGFAVWTWLLRYLPASSVGFTVFLNPPLTTLSKLALAALAPATFVLAVTTQELVGGGLTLVGMAIALSHTRRAGQSS